MNMKDYVGDCLTTYGQKEKWGWGKKSPFLEHNDKDGIKHSTAWAAEGRL